MIDINRDLFSELSEQIKGKGTRIVFPEANDKRVLGAVVRLFADGLIQPILLGDEAEIKALARENFWHLEGIEIINPETYEGFDELADAFVERRGGRNTKEEALEIIKDKAYFGTMLVQEDIADGLVCGAVYSTGDTVRPALQIIRTKPGVKLTSGGFIMLPREYDGQRLYFADCAININPDAEQLAEIAVQSAETAAMFNIDPRVALLSFSTHGSAKSPEVDKVVEATKIAKEMAPDLPIDGELQFDAAYVESVARQKVSDSDVAGNANIFVFPEIQSGNIGYKIAQRLGGYQAIGPILSGLNKSVSDLSRGCNEEDVYKISIITAVQAIALNE